MSPIRVLIIEDNAAFVEAASAFLNSRGRIAVVGVVRSPVEALSRVADLRPDVVIATLDLPESSGLIAAARIKALHDPPCVVVLTDREELPYKRLAEAIAADGFLLKRNFTAGIEPLLAELASRPTRPVDARPLVSADESLARLAAPRTVLRPFEQPYGDLTQLNQNRLILDSVGKDILTEIVCDYLEVLGTSAAVYEKNGDYALGTFSSGWCRLLDAGSRACCDTSDNRVALASGKWHCHESCWQASRTSMENCQPVDMECLGGVRLYAVPIVARGEVVGSINFGYGTPCNDADALAELARLYKVDPDLLAREAAVCRAHPPAVIEIAKRRLHTAARLIGEIVGRRQVETELRKSESRFRRLVESNIVGVIIADFDGAVIEANDAFLKMIGYTREELARGQIHWTDLTPPEFRRFDEEALASWRREGNAAPWEKEYKRKDGSRVPVCVGLAQLEENADYCVALVLDLSRQKGAQRALVEQREQLLHAQKMATLGTLAAGMAHDFNNLLTAIFGYTEIVREEAGTSPKLLDAADHLQKAAEQAAAVSRSLLTFSRKGATRRRSTDLNALAHQLANMARRLTPDSITVVSELGGTTPLWIHADESQIFQVLLNIAINARDAMPRGGTLGLRLKHAPPESTQAGDAEFGYAVIEIEDDGVGMSLEVQQRMFEPFFTTKRRGHGTGLGMAIVNAIVQEHGGTIDVESALDRGTRIAVTLPCCAPPAAHVDREAGRPRPRGRGETVLLADDNPYVRQIVAASLTAAGFEVIECDDGIEAIGEYVRYGPRIRALILDADMPRLGGVPCLARIRETRPDLPAIIITGSENVIRNGGDIKNTVILRKPFQMVDLAEAVMRLITAQQSQPASMTDGSANTVLS